MAYCLLGLFDVTMPLLYGEGGVGAFLRLQKEIANQTTDEILFPWTANIKVGGIFAPHPKCFEISGDIDETSYANLRPPYSITNKGFGFSLPKEVFDHADADGTILAYLACRLRSSSSAESFLCIHL